MTEPEGPTPAGESPPAGPGLKNRLDAALDRLEDVVRARIEHPMRRLREAIAAQRKIGPFNEDRLADEIEQIASRDRMNLIRQSFSVETEIDSLILRLVERGFP